MISGLDKPSNFHPIDHLATFAFLDDYKQVRDIVLTIEPKKSILTASIVRTIANFASPNSRAALKDEILFSMEVALINLDVIFEQVPPYCGFNKRVFKCIFSDKDRNNRIANSYLTTFDKWKATLAYYDL